MYIATWFFQLQSSGSAKCLLLSTQAKPFALFLYNVMILSFRTELSLGKQGRHSLHCLQFRLHHLDPLLFGKAILFKF